MVLDWARPGDGASLLAGGGAAGSRIYWNPVISLSRNESATIRYVGLD